MRFTLIQYSNQFALGGWSWTVLTYRVQRKVLTSDLGRSYLLPTRARVRTAIRPDGNDANCPDILMETTWQIFGPAHYHFKQLDENTSSSLS